MYRLRVLPMFASALLLSLAHTAIAQTTPVVDKTFAASGTQPADELRQLPVRHHIWIVEQHAGRSFDLLHRHHLEPTGQLYRALSGNGTVLAATGEGPNIFLFYASGEVQRITYHDDLPPRPPIFDSLQLTTLPRGGKLLFATRTHAGPVALMFYNSPPELPAPPSKPPADSAPTNGNASPSDSPATPAMQVAPAGPGMWLLELRGLYWHSIPLPTGLLPEHIIGLTTTGEPAAGLEQLALLTRTDATGYTLHRRSNDQWTQQPIEVDSDARETRLRSIHPATSASSLLLIREPTSERKLDMLLLRGESAKLLATVDLPESTQQWHVVQDDESLRVLAFREMGRYESTSISFPSGIEVDPWQSLGTTVRPTEWQPLLIVFVAAIVLATIILMTRSRPEARLIPNLPEGTTLATLARVAAALVDLTPGVLFVMYYFEISNPLEIFSALMRPAKMQEMLPGFIAIGIHTGHCTLTELFTGRTIGKRIFGCRVVNYSGNPPHIWQILSRNLFKIVELSFPFLLILPWFSAYYQRIGDLLSRTLVVNTTHQSPANPPTENDPKDPPKQ